MKLGPIGGLLPRQGQGTLLEDLTSQLGTEGWAGIIQAKLGIRRVGESSVSAIIL